jgi:predicted ABC-type transport system involved in lysophospholipase L1 biosynthesis ATPase subunit
VLFQQGALFSSLTALQNVEFPLRENATLSDELMTEIASAKLEMVGLAPEDGAKFPSERSGGMTKRVALARANTAAIGLRGSKPAILSSMECPRGPAATAVQFRIAIFAEHSRPTLTSRTKEFVARERGTIHPHLMYRRLTYISGM